MEKLRNISKDKIRKLINEFCLTDDLMKLSEAQILINALLRKNNFPFEEYNKWLKNKKK